MSHELFYVINSLVWSVVGFVAGWVIASLRRDVTKIREAVGVPQTTFVAVRGHRMTTQTATRILGIIVALLAVATVVEAAIFVDRQNDIARCQAEYNTRFAEVSQRRAALADEDRRALQNMLLALYQQRNEDPEARLRTFERWVKTTQENEADRRAHPLPDLPKGDCR